MILSNMRITEYQLLETAGAEAVFLRWRGATGWVIQKLTGDVLNKAGQWEWEPYPSARTEDFIGRTRFPTAEAALEYYNGTYDEYTKTKH